MGEVLRRRAAPLLVVLFLGACASDDAPESTASGEPLKACLDTPGALDYPPDGRLPCELIPPGLTLP